MQYSIIDDCGHDRETPHQVKDPRMGHWLQSSSIPSHVLLQLFHVFVWLNTTWFQTSLSNMQWVFTNRKERNRPVKRNCPVVESCGIDPRTSGRMDCDVIDVNSAPDESAKEGFYFHVHGSHLYVSLAWSFTSCFGRLCSRVAVALAWLLH